MPGWIAWAIALGASSAPPSKTPYRTSVVLRRPLPFLAAILLFWTVSMFGFASVVRTLYLSRLPIGGLVAPVAPTARAGEMRDAARRFEARAEALMVVAQSPTAAATDVKKLRESADSYSTWARDLEQQAAAGQVIQSRDEAFGMLWQVAVATDFPLCAVAIVAGFAIIATAFRQHDYSRRFCLVIATAVILLPVLVFVLFWQLWPDYSYGFLDLIPKLVGQLPLAVMKADDGIHLAAGWLYLAAVGTLCSPPRDAKFSKEEVDRVARGMRTLRRIVYMFAVLLVVYVVAESAFFHWPLAWFRPGQKDLDLALQSLVSGAVMMRSVQAVSLEVALCFPAFFVLHLQAVHLARELCEDPAPEAQEEWLKKNGLAAATTMEQLKPVAAVLVPLVTGPVVQLLGGLAK